MGYPNQCSQSFILSSILLISLAMISVARSAPAPAPLAQSEGMEQIFSKLAPIFSSFQGQGMRAPAGGKQGQSGGVSLPYGGGGGGAGAASGYRSSDRDRSDRERPDRLAGVQQQQQQQQAILRPIQSEGKEAKEGCLTPGALPPLPGSSNTDQEPEASVSSAVQGSGRDRSGNGRDTPPAPPAFVSAGSPAASTNRALPSSSSSGGGERGQQMQAEAEPQVSSETVSSGNGQQPVVAAAAVPAATPTGRGAGGEPNNSERAATASGSGGGASGTRVESGRPPAAAATPAASNTGVTATGSDLSPLPEPVREGRRGGGGRAAQMQGSSASSQEQEERRRMQAEQEAQSQSQSRQQGQASDDSMMQAMYGQSKQKMADLNLEQKVEDVDEEETEHFSKAKKSHKKSASNTVRALTREQEEAVGMAQAASSRQQAFQAEQAQQAQSASREMADASLVRKSADASQHQAQAMEMDDNPDD